MNNLRVAIEQLPPEFEILVFADSDGRPGKSWLQRLTAPLSDDRVGATTTMRWLVPNSNMIFLRPCSQPGTRRSSPCSPKRARNFCWGGGTAIRRTVFEQIGVLDDWRTSVSDDYSFTTCSGTHPSLHTFRPRMLHFPFVETDFAGLVEFTNRKILITRVYAEKMWAARSCHALPLLPHGTLGTGTRGRRIVAQRPALSHRRTDVLYLSAVSHSRQLRVVAVTEILPAARAQIMSQSWIYILLTSLVPFWYCI